MEQTQPVIFYEDNQSTFALARRDTMMSNDRTKHIDVRYHYTRQLVTSNQIALTYVPTQHQVADIITKDLAKTAFRPLAVQILNVNHIQDMATETETSSVRNSSVLRTPSTTSRIPRRGYHRVHTNTGIKAMKAKRQNEGKFNRNLRIYTVRFGLSISFGI